MASRREFLFGLGPPYARPARPLARVSDSCFELQGIVCGNCRDACATHAVRFLPLGAGTSKPVIDPARCDGCGECVSACPAGAIAITPTPELQT